MAEIDLVTAANICRHAKFIYTKPSPHYPSNLIPATTLHVNDCAFLLKQIPFVATEGAVTAYL